MQTDVKGCSGCLAGEERFERFTAKGGSFVQYDRRHVNGQLFACVAKTLQAARQRYKKWADHQH
jgi:hypothetical protein